MSFDRIARFVSGVDSFLPYQQDRVAPLPARASSSFAVKQPPPPNSSARTTPDRSATQPRRVSSVLAHSDPHASDGVLFPLVAYQPLATFNVAYYHRVKVRYLFLFSSLTTLLTLAVLVVYAIFFHDCAWYLLPTMATATVITVVLPLLTLCQREIAGRWYTTLAFSFLLGHFASFTWWNFSPSPNDILTSYNSLSPAVLLLCSYFLMNLSTALLFAVLTFTVELVQSVLIIIGRPDLPNNISMFAEQQVWLYLLDCGHVSILFLLVFLLLQAWQQEHEGDLHEAERLLVDTGRRAEQNNVNKSVFMSALAHDIRTPLNGIMAGLALTLDDPALSLSSEHRDYLQMAHSSASSLLYLLNDILDISRLDSCSLRFERVEFDLVDTVERTVRSFALDAERQSVQLMVDVSTTAPAAVRGDPVRLGQLLSNIISNALKFSERGGAVSVSCEAVTLDSDELTLHTAAADGQENSVVVDVNKTSVRFVPVGASSSPPRPRRSPRTGSTPAAHLLPVAPPAASTARSERHPHGRVCLHFSVRDEGCGIPADRLQSVFGRFEQASHDVAQLYAGRGLGLAIAAGLVRLFDGKIWCESVVKPPVDSAEQTGGPTRQQQHGSTFHFLVHLDLLPSDTVSHGTDEDSSQTPSHSSPLSAVPVRRLDSLLSSPAAAPKPPDESLLNSALARVRRLTNRHSRMNSVALQASISLSAALVAAPAAVPAGQQLSSRISAVSARLLSQATGSANSAIGGSVGGGHQLRASVSVSTGEPVSAVLRRELHSSRSTDSPALAVSGAVDGRSGRAVTVVAPRSPSGPSNERRQAWDRWCLKYAAVLVCITPQQTRQTVTGWVQDWLSRKRADGRAEEDRPREPPVIAVDSEGQLMSSISEQLTNMQLHRTSSSSPRRELAAQSALELLVPAAQTGARLDSRSSVSSTRTESATLRDESSPSAAARLLLVIDDFLVSAEPTATTLTTGASALAAAVGLTSLSHTATAPSASPNLSFPSAARHTHLTRNRHAAKCLKMASTLLKARLSDVDAQIDVLFLLSAGSAAMRVDWPGLRYSGSMTSPASRLSLYRLLDAAATGSDGGGGERTVLYRSERFGAAPQQSPRAPLLNLAASTATAHSQQSASGGEQATMISRTPALTISTGPGSDGWQSGLGTSGGGAMASSRTNSPASQQTLPAAGHTSRLTDATSSLYIPSSRSALAQPTLHISSVSHRKQGEPATARRPAVEQQRQQDSAGDADREHCSPRTVSTSSSPRPRPPLLLHALSSGCLNQTELVSESLSVSTRPLVGLTVEVGQDDTTSTVDTLNPDAGPQPSLPPSAAAAVASQAVLPPTANLDCRSESLPPQPTLARSTDHATTRLAAASQPIVAAPVLPAPHTQLSPSRSVSAPAAGMQLGVVLVVDDNLINRKMAASVLKRMGLQSHLCESGEEALSVFKHTLDAATGVSRFVCCLMDIRMPPGISGHECTRLMREWETQQVQERSERRQAATVSGSHTRLPIFALTANVLDDDRQLAVEVGMQAYLEKPLNAALLKQQLTKFHIPTVESTRKASTAPKK